MAYSLLRQLPLARDPLRLLLDNVCLPILALSLDSALLLLFSCYRDICISFGTM
jgi:hypothetical protein